MTGVGVRSLAVGKLGGVGVERKIDAQGFADDRDFRHDVAAPAIGVAMTAYAALDFGRALRRGGERLFQHGVTLLDDVVCKGVLLGEAKALARRLFLHDFPDVDSLAQAKSVVLGFVGCGGDVGRRRGSHGEHGVRARGVARLGAEGAVVVAPAHIVSARLGFQPLFHIELVLQQEVFVFFHYPESPFPEFCPLGFLK